MGATEQLWQRLTADATLQALLATYVGEDEDGDPVEGPAVFVASGERASIPEDAARPYLVIHGPRTTPDDVKNCEGRRQSWTIRTVTDNDGSSAPCRLIAEAVRAALHRLPVGLDDGAWMASCSGPSPVPSDPDVIAFDDELVLAS